jgi:hypothetical protein
VSVLGLNNGTKYYWRVGASNDVGGSPWSDIWSFTTTGVDRVAEIGEPFSVAVYPNPFSKTTTLHFTLAGASAATLEVCDLLGRAVARQEYGMLPAGDETITFDGSHLAGGTYYYTLETTAAKARGVLYISK